MKLTDYARLLSRATVAVGLFALTACNGDDVDFLPSDTSLAENCSLTFNLGDLPATDESGATVLSGRDSLAFTIAQRSSYRDMDGSVYECTPLTTVRLHATADTVRGENIYDLTRITALPVETTESGSTPTQTTTRQAFKVGDQTVVFDLMHETYRHTNAAGQTVRMPYVLVDSITAGPQWNGTRGMAKPAAVTVKPLKDMPGATAADSLRYEVTAHFHLDITPQHTTQTDKRTLEFEVKYVAEATTRLVDVKYRKEMLCIPVEDRNYQLPTSFGFIVYRDRIYSNGITKTDKFFSGMWLSYVCCKSHYTHYVYDDWYYTDAGDSIYIHQPNAIYEYGLGVLTEMTCSFAVESLDDVHFEEYFFETELDLRPWEEYYDANLYDEDLSVENFEIPGTRSTTEEPITLQNGWYGEGGTSLKRDIFYYKEHNNSSLFLMADLLLVWVDLYLVIDKKRITFEEFRPRCVSRSSFDEELPPSGNRGRAKIYRSSLEADCRGYKLRAEFTDTIYERLKTK